MCLNLVDCIILIRSFSNSFNSSTGGGFLVDCARVEEKVSFPTHSAEKLLGFFDETL